MRGPDRSRLPARTLLPHLRTVVIRQAVCRFADDELPRMFVKRSVKEFGP
jgi:hypothetical protein